MYGSCASVLSQDNNPFGRINSVLSFLGRINSVLSCGKALIYGILVCLYFHGIADGIIFMF